MKNNRGLIFTLVVLFMLCVVLIAYLWDDGGYSWQESYKTDGDQPFDLEIFVKLLEKNTYQTGLERIDKPLNKSLAALNPEQTYTLLAIKRAYYPDTAEIRALLAFVNQGNTLWLSSEEITPLLPLAFGFGMDTITALFNHLTAEEHYAYVPDSVRQAYEDTYSWEVMDSIHDAYKIALQNKIQGYSYLETAFESDSATLCSTSKVDTATLSRPYKNTLLSHQWMSINPQTTKPGQPLAWFTNKQLPAAVTYPVGSGQLVLSSTPLLFTNYFIRQKEHFNLINTMLGSAPKNSLLLDDVSRFKADWWSGTGFGAKLSQSPLSFILAQRALAWAWFTLLGTTLLFLLFRSKRRQRIIPVIKPNHNTTLAYAQLLGSLQLKEKNNTTKGQEIFQHFLQHLRARNRWHGNTANDELKQKLIKLAPDLSRQIEIVLHLGDVATKSQVLSNQQLITLFNYTNLIIQRT